MIQKNILNYYFFLNGELIKLTTDGIRRIYKRSFGNKKNDYQRT